MVPGGMERQRQLLRSRLRQSTAGNSQEWILPGRLARERQLLHPLNVPSCEHLGITGTFGSGEQMFGEQEQVPQGDPSDKEA
jgi:hypothetical protein